MAPLSLLFPRNAPGPPAWECCLSVVRHQYRWTGPSTFASCPLTPPSLPIHPLSIVQLTNEFRHGSESEHIPDWIWDGWVAASICHVEIAWCCVRVLLVTCLSGLMRNGHSMWRRCFAPADDHFHLISCRFLSAWHLSGIAANGVTQQWSCYHTRGIALPPTARVIRGSISPWLFRVEIHLELELCRTLLICWEKPPGVFNSTRIFQKGNNLPENAGSGLEVQLKAEQRSAAPRPSGSTWRT